MINAACNGKGVGVGENGSPAHDKQPLSLQKKTALRDIQNGNVFGSVQKQQESLPFGGTNSGDAIKASGIKQPKLEFPSSPPCLPSVASNGENENVKNARLRFQLELDKGRLQKMDIYSDNLQSRKMCQLSQEMPQQRTQMRGDSNPIHRVPAGKSNLSTPVVPFSVTGSLGARSLEKQNNETQIGSVSIHDQLRTERFIRLQKFLKQCDEAKQVEYIKMLLHLNPTELSRHAVELEKRTMQLSIEEAQEMQRAKALNVLGKSVPANTPIHSTQFLNPNK